VFNFKAAFMASGKNEFTKELQNKVRLVNQTLEQILSRKDLISKELRAPVRYALMGPGKRIRAAIVLWCCEMISGKVNRDAETAAAAIEMVHTYSLVHDDLPAMDDDDYRRGRLTCHKKFDEATAILVGDGLLTLAFEVLGKEIKSPVVSGGLISELAEAAGPAGMVAGQMADLDFENKKADEKKLRYIHTNKTAKMFRCAAAMGGICGGADKKELKHLREFGLKVGLGFQIADDILDVCGTSKQLGKTSGKDARQGKQTYPAVVGLEKSKKLAGEIADEAAAALELFGNKAELLRRLVEMLLTRTK
jgi:geranylgeranyl diphosphate synthase, type II